MKIDCDQLADMLPEFFDGSLSEEQSDSALDHLATCDACRLTVDELEGVRTLASEHGRLEMPSDARERIRRSIGLT
jgi:predicted anti-sigma-YlaC factor YlaD